MEIYDKHDKGYIEVRLTNAEQQLYDRRELTRCLLEKANTKKCKVVYFLSGSDDLLGDVNGDGMANQLKHSSKKLPEGSFSFNVIQFTGSFVTRPASYLCIMRASRFVTPSPLPVTPPIFLLLHETRSIWVRKTAMSENSILMNIALCRMMCSE